ncbi:MAG: ribosome biogenesis GTPase Der [Candidatus Zixiibacteriota bacterium]
MENEGTFPRVILLGRPNVGKSTMFNRLVGRNIAMTDSRPHTTRDVLAEICRFGDAGFELVDAAGFLATPDDTLAQSIKRGLDAAAASADLVVLLFDGREGLLPLDRELADFVRRLHKPVVPVVNKIDSPSLVGEAADFYELGFEREPVVASATNGYNCRELVDVILEELGPAANVVEREDEERLTVAIVGRPNVGKSSLLNRLAGSDRVVVHETPGTTRDAVDVAIEHEGREYLFVDTAGIRRRARAKERLELWSLGKSFGAVKRASVVLLVLDGAEGPTAQDAKIAGYADHNGRGLLLFVNKTDLLIARKEKEAKEADEADEDAPPPEDVTPEERVARLLANVREELNFATYASALTGSATEGIDVDQVFRAIGEVDENRRARLGTGGLNRYLREAMERRRFRAGQKEIRLLYATQVSTAPPTFHLFLNVSRKPPLTFTRFIENRLREAFPLVGTPIRLVFRLRDSASARK